MTPYCTDQQLSEVSRARAHCLWEANLLRPPRLEHAAQRGDSNGHLSRLPRFGPRAQRVTNHALVAADTGLHQGTAIVTASLMVSMPPIRSIDIRQILGHRRIYASRRLQLMGSPPSRD